MPQRTLERGYGKVFDTVAEEYDRQRPAYPEELLDHVCEVAALRPGDRVLEVGCGSGQLTRDLLARGLRVVAVEPGDRLIALARRNLGNAGEVEFVNGRLEDSPLPSERFQAVFSASALHWIDPDFAWRKTADALVSGGTLALVQYFGVSDPRSADDQQALLGAIAKVAPRLAASWPTYREPDALLEGARERRANVSEMWSSLGDYDLARDCAADLFEQAQVAAVARLVEHTADELGALLRTMSFWSGLSPQQRATIEGENRALYERLGRKIRSSILACAVTARRSGLGRLGPTLTCNDEKTPANAERLALNGLGRESSRCQRAARTRWGSQVHRPQP
jgi:SAM-dependent methyltransferase